MTNIDIRRADERFATELDWLDSKHSFSFGPHHDAGNTHHGLLLVNNDDVVRAGAGFGMHGHNDMEIVTWVLSGELEHRDSEGNHGLLTPGLAQRMSAGTGIRHSEFNPNPSVDAHFVQMWVLPDTQGIAPGYEQVDVTEQLDAGELVAVAGGAGSGAAITLNQRDAMLWVGRLTPGTQVDVPVDRHVHVFVALGSGTLDVAGPLETGDAVRLTDAGPLAFTAGPAGAEVLIWATA